MSKTMILRIAMGFSSEPNPPMQDLTWLYGTLACALILVGVTVSVALYIHRINRRLSKSLVERSLAEDVKEEALSRLQKIASRLPGVVYQFRMRHDGSFCVPYASEGVRDIWRFGPEDVRDDASKAFSLVHPDDLDKFMASIKSSARDLTAWKHEFRLKFGDEPDKWLFGNAMPQREADGSTLWHGFITDISESVQTKEALKKSEERWKFALEGSGDGVYDWNIRTGEVVTSERWKEMFGFEGKSFTEWANRVHPEDMPFVMAELQAHLDGKTPYAAFEFRMALNDGGWKWTLGRGMVVGRDAEGKALRMVGTNSDITGRKLAEEALRKSEHFLRESQVISGLGSYVLDIPTGLWESSEVLDKIMGIDKMYERNDEGRAALLHTDDRAMIVDYLKNEVIGRGQPFDKEYRIIRPDNKAERWLHGVCRLEFDSKGNPVKMHGTIQDITERKQAEIELRQAKEQAESATKLKDQFVEMVAHDLRSPLTSMMWLLRLLMERKSINENEKDKKDLGAVLKSGDRIIAMIGDLLKLTRLQTGRITPHSRFFKAHAAAEFAIDSLAHATREKGIEVVNEVPVNMRLYADQSLFDEVLLNLLSNAVKFCSAGEKITFFAPPGSKSSIAIRDTGKGIDENHMPDLFKHEVKTTTHGTAGERGTGLGLPYCHDIVKAHGGDITVDSAPGKGSVFCVTLPYVKPVALVVEDDPLALMALGGYLEKIGIDVVEAMNGEQALEVLSDKTPHIIITDINMPGMDGFALMGRLKSDTSTSGIPVIVMTGSDGETRENAFRRGADDFVGKPVTLEDFMPRVRRFLG